jgi:transcriptional regulator with XRE-family HTH domain
LWVVPTKSQHQARYAPLPALLRAIREEAHFSQRELGRLLNRPQSWVYSCETGNRRVDLAEFCDWCRACKVSPADGIRRFEKHLH